MDTKDEEFLKRLQAIFQVEAEEHIRELSSCLIELEKTPKYHNTNPQRIEHETSKFRKRRFTHKSILSFSRIF